MGSGRTPRLGPLRMVEAGTRVGRLEVFFDLVFVFGFFHIVRLLSDELNPRGLVKGVLVLALLWLCWLAHMLSAHRIMISEGVAPLITFATMAAVLAIALTSPHAFGDGTAGLPGPLLFPLLYVTIRILNLWFHWYAARDEPGERRQLLRLGVATVVSTGLLLLAAVLPWLIETSQYFALQVGLWTLAVVVELGTGLAIGLSGWQLPGPGHFAARFELIIIIALGESLISIGIGSNVIGRPLTWADLLAAVLGIVVTATLWWAYFDLIAPAAELAMRASHGRARIALARDGYMYLHLPMIAGLILFAVGGEEVLKAYGAGDATLIEPLHGIGSRLLYAGVALYLASLTAFQLRVLGTVLWTRVAVIVLFCVTVPVASRLPSVVALGLLSGVCVALVTVETVLFADSRLALRDAVRHER